MADQTPEISAASSPVQETSEHHLQIDDSQQVTGTEHHKMVDKNGWDGKLRVGPRAVITNPEALSDPEYSDDDAPPVEQISADEGTSSSDDALIVQD